MPFRGVGGDGDPVWPDEVTRGDRIFCPECEDEMHVRRGHTTEGGVHKPRCFSHNPDSPVGGMCSGGESDEHKVMKYVVDRRLRKLFDHATVARERSVSGTSRVADVLVEFDDSIDNLGRGVVAEVQYRHDSKDIEATTQEYLRAGYSVYWLNESHFSDSLETVSLPDIVPAWPNAVPTPAEWSGLRAGSAELGSFSSRYPIEARFPPEFAYNHTEQLRRWWKIGSGRYDIDLWYRLSENNAPRRCGVCGNGASHYFFEDGVVSTFRCDSHLVEAAEVTPDV